MFDSFRYGVEGLRLGESFESLPGSLLQDFSYKILERSL
jgi:hypothetical protein